MSAGSASSVVEQVVEQLDERAGGRSGTAGTTRGPSACGGRRSPAAVGSRHSVVRSPHLAIVACGSGGSAAVACHPGGDVRRGRGGPAHVTNNTHDRSITMRRAVLAGVGAAVGLAVAACGPPAPPPVVIGPPPAPPAAVQAQWGMNETERSGHEGLRSSPPHDGAIGAGRRRERRRRYDFPGWVNVVDGNGNFTGAPDPGRRQRRRRCPTPATSSSPSTARSRSTAPPAPPGRDRHAAQRRPGHRVQPHAEGAGLQPRRLLEGRDPGLRQRPRARAVHPR